MKKLLLLLTVFLSSIASYGQSTTYTGTIKDLSLNVVTSGQVTFTLTPKTDSTIPGTGRFTPSTITCNINSDGTLSGFVGGTVSGACTVAMNTAISPSGTSYRVCIQPNYATPGSCFYDYATTASKDISTVAPTLPTGPINYGGVPGPIGPIGPQGVPGVVNATGSNGAFNVPGPLTGNGWGISPLNQTIYASGSSYDCAAHLAGNHVGPVENTTTTDPLTGATYTQIGCNNSSFMFGLWAGQWNNQRGNYYNNSVDGKGTAQAVTDYTNSVTYLGVTVPSPHSVSPAVTCSAFATNPKSCPREIFVLGMSTVINSLFASESYASILSDVQTLVAAARADGYYVVVLDMPDIITGNIPASSQLRKANIAARDGRGQLASSTTTNVITSDMYLPVSSWIMNTYGSDYDGDALHLNIQGVGKVVTYLNAAFSAGGSPSPELYRPIGGTPNQQGGIITVTGNGNYAVAMEPGNIGEAPFNITCQITMTDAANTFRASSMTVSINSYGTTGSFVPTITLSDQYSIAVPSFGTPFEGISGGLRYLMMPVINFVSGPNYIQSECTGDGLTTFLIPTTQPTGVTLSTQATRYNKVTSSIHVTGNGNIVIAEFPPQAYSMTCNVWYPDPDDTSRVAFMTIDAAGFNDFFAEITQRNSYNFAAGAPIFGSPLLSKNATNSNIQLAIPIQNFATSSNAVVGASCVSDIGQGFIVLPGTTSGAVVNSFLVGPSSFGIYQELLHTPASSSETCTAGQFTDDANYHYVCTVANTWKRVAITTF